MHRFVMLPGIGGSGPDHWQTLWEARSDRSMRFAPSSWDAPDIEDWISALEEAVARSGGSPVLVAHSLACLLTPHWAARSQRTIAAAILVAPPDPQAPTFPDAARGFADPPRGRLRFPSLVISSATDPFAAEKFAERQAIEWGAAHVSVGPHGHLNAESGLADWPEGRRLINDFLGL